MGGEKGWGFIAAVVILTDIRLRKSERKKGETVYLCHISITKKEEKFTSPGRQGKIGADGPRRKIRGVPGEE